jgi:hypothetical protein
MGNVAQNYDGVALRIEEQESPTMWQDFYGELRPFNNVSMYKNDFHSWIADEWTVTEVGTSLQVLTDQRGGVLRLTSGGTEDNGNNLQLGGSADGETVGECFAPASATNLWLEARIKSDDVTQHDFFVGISVEDTAILATPGQALIGFRTDDGDASLDFVSRAGSVSSEASAISTLANDTWIKIGFKVTNTEKIECYVNDVLKATVTTTIPTELMKLSIAQLTGEGNAASLDVDYIVCAQDRG